MKFSALRNIGLSQIKDLGKVALKKANLMLEGWIRSICIRAFHGKVVEQISGPKIGASLRNQLCTLHGLTVPIGGTINGHFDTTELRGHSRVLVVRGDN